MCSSDLAEAKIAEATARADRAEAERDAAKAEVEQIRADAMAQARARVALETAVRSVMGATYNCDGKSDREIRVDALAKLGVTAGTDKSDDYVLARFDAALEAAAANQSASRIIADAMNAQAPAQLPALSANNLAAKAWH